MFVLVIVFIQPLSQTVSEFFPRKYKSIWIRTSIWQHTLPLALTHKISHHWLRIQFGWLGENFLYIMPNLCNKEENARNQPEGCNAMQCNDIQKISEIFKDNHKMYLNRQQRKILIK